MTKLPKNDDNKFLSEQEKWKIFFEVISRRYIYIPVISILIYLIDDPHINIIGSLIKMGKEIIGINI